MTTLAHDLGRKFEEVRERLDDAIERLIPGRREEDRGTSALAPRTPRLFGPSIDLEETADAVILRADLPGLSPNDFTVEATPRRVIIRGKKSEEHEEKDRAFHRVERLFGSFVRAVDLPCDISPDQISAAYKDGVLQLTMPKTEASRGRRVHVDVG